MQFSTMMVALSRPRAIAATALLAFGLGLSNVQVQAQSANAGSPGLSVQGAWARATVPGQLATGVFMTLQSREAMSLVGLSSPAAGVAEVHEMKMDGQVMRMRAVPVLELPAGQAVALKPGGYHLMLLDLKAPLMVSKTVPITLKLRDAQGKLSEHSLQVPVLTQPPGGAAGAADAHQHKHH